jgi:hypothetical protein
MVLSTLAPATSLPWCASSCTDDGTATHATPWGGAVYVIESGGAIEYSWIAATAAMGNAIHTLRRIAQIVVCSCDH